MGFFLPCLLHKQSCNLDNQFIPFGLHVMQNDLCASMQTNKTKLRLGETTSPFPLLPSSPFIFPYRYKIMFRY